VDGASYFLFGQMMVLSGYFQALGDPPPGRCLRVGAALSVRAAADISVPYAFARPHLDGLRRCGDRNVPAGVAGAVAESQAVRLAIRASAKLKRESRAIAGAALERAKLTLRLSTATRVPGRVWNFQTRFGPAITLR